MQARQGAAINGKPVMTFRDTVGLALRNLSQAKLRTALTMLGVSIGIASLAGMVSLGVGLQEQVVGRFLQSAVFDSVTVVQPAELGGAAQFLNGRGRGGFRPDSGGRGNGSGSSQTPAPKLDENALKQIAAMDEVREVYPNIRVPVQLAIEDFSRQVALAGVPMSSKGEGAFQTFSYGAFFTGDSDHDCMLSLNMAKQIAEQAPGSLVGKTATVTYPARAKDKPADLTTGFDVHPAKLECRIVGIVERDPGGLPFGGLGPNVGVMIPLGLARSIDAEIVFPDLQSLLRDPSAPKSYGTVTVKVKQAKWTQDVEDRLRRMGYAALSVNDALRGAKTAFILFDIVQGLVGSIALVVSSLGIVNTMVMSILERTREIGIMKAIGADNEHIRRIFLIEASVIGVLGGMFGVALGWTVGRAINFGANLYIRSQGGTPGTIFSMPVWLIAAAIAFSVLVSLIAGSYPASRAAKLDPIQALRHD
jgi:putative ABC transport system permease protein